MFRVTDEDNNIIRFVELCSVASHPCLPPNRIKNISFLAFCYSTGSNCLFFYSSKCFKALIYLTFRFSQRLTTFI